MSDDDSDFCGLMLAVFTTGNLMKAIFITHADLEIWDSIQKQKQAIHDNNYDACMKEISTRSM